MALGGPASKLPVGHSDASPVHANGCYRSALARTSNAANGRGLNCSGYSDYTARQPRSDARRRAASGRQGAGRRARQAGVQSLRALWSRDSDGRERMGCRGRARPRPVRSLGKAAPGWGRSRSLPAGQTLIASRRTGESPGSSRSVGCWSPFAARRSSMPTRLPTSRGAYPPPWAPRDR